MPLPRQNRIPNMHHSFVTSLKRAAIFAAVLTLTTVAQAQIGTGWTLINPSKNLQKVGNVTYSNSSGVELFRLNDASAARCEQRIVNDYTSGSHQFQGEVKVSGTPRSSGQSVQQILESTTGQGDASQVRWYSSSSGTFKVNGVTMATGVNGVYQRINCIHYRGTGKIELYHNGTRKETHNDFGAGKYYFKYGIYIAGSSGRPTAEWRNIRVWKK
jgi:hypothetical protein